MGQEWSGRRREGRTKASGRVCNTGLRPGRVKDSHQGSHELKAGRVKDSHQGSHELKAGRTMRVV